MRFLSVLLGIAMLGGGACAKGNSIAAGGAGGAAASTTGAPGGAGPSGPTSNNASGTQATASATTAVGPGTTTAATTTSATTSATTTTAASTTAATTAASTSSTGAMCSESPCKLTSPQCGCGAGLECSIIGASRACIAAGSQGTGQTCSTTNECQPGDLCLAPKTVNSCLKFCNSDSDCVAPGGICYFTVNNGMGGTVPNATLCTQNCDPTSATSCIVAGLGCQAARDMTTNKTLTYCPESGTAGYMGACPNGSSDCQAGYGCFTTTSNVCLHWCKFPSGAGCTGVTTCGHLNPPMIIGTTEYGACG